MTTPASRVTAEKSEAAALSDERLWLVTAGPDGEVSHIAVGFDAMMDAVVRCIWDDPSGEEGADQMREEMADPDFWSGDFWSCQWAFEDGYLQVQRITDASALRSVPPDSVAATPTLSVEGIVREIEVLLDNCHVVEDIDIAAQHEAVMVLVRSLSDSVSDGSKGVRVKPLEWVGDEAQTPFGKYRVYRTDDGYGVSFEYDELVHVGFNSVGAFESPRDTAISYAQPHYHQRILFSLDSGTGGQQPVAPPERCPHCDLHWGHNPPAIIFGTDNVRCIECKTVFPTEPKAGVVSEDSPGPQDQHGKEGLGTWGC